MLTIQGYIFSERTGELLHNVTTRVINYEGNFVTQPALILDGFYEAWTDALNPSKVFVQFEKEGYEPLRVQFLDLQRNPDVNMELATSPGAAIGVATVAAVAAAVAAAIALARKEKRKISGITTADVMPFILIGGAVIAFDLVNKVLVMLGISDSRDTKELDDIATDPNSFWNPEFWRGAPGGNYSYAITESTARAWLSEIKSAFGPFNDDEEKVIGVFKRCRTQANASFLAWVFNKDTGQDLLKYLRGGTWPQDRLSDADVNEITRYIKNLPKY